MQLVDSVLSYLMPEILITDPDWREKWSVRQKDNFLRYAGFFFFIVAIGQIANHFFFDIPMGLEPREFWLNYRMSMAVMAGACMFFYISPLTRYGLYKAPALIACIVMCYTQAYVTIWYSADAWVFFYIFVIATMMVLGMRVIWSLLYTLGLCVAAAPVIQEAGIVLEYTVSATIVTMLFAVIIQRSALSAVRGFILAEENLAQQTRIA